MKGIKFWNNLPVGWLRQRSLTDIYIELGMYIWNSARQGCPCPGVRWVLGYSNGVLWFPAELLQLDSEKLSQSLQKANRGKSPFRRGKRVSHKMMSSQTVHSSSLTVKGNLESLAEMQAAGTYCGMTPSVRPLHTALPSSQSREQFAFPHQ